MAGKLKKESQLKKLWTMVQCSRIYSPAEIHEVESKLKDGSAPTIKSEVSPSSVNLLEEQSKEIKSPSPKLNERPSITLFHPDHAKLAVQQTVLQPIYNLEQQFLTLASTSQMTQNGGITVPQLSSSATSSISSIPGESPFVAASFESLQYCENRRDSTLTNKFSLLDALDLECTLIKAAARGSVGPYSLSQSPQKLSFTQSLAFPALARKLSNKQNSSESTTKGPRDPLDSGVNAFVKVVTVLVLVLISVLVFGVLYNFIRT